MKKSIKTFKLSEKYKGYTILVYGELWEEGYVDGIVIRRAKFSKDGRKVMDESATSEEILLNRPYTRTRYFNMGWAICTPDDIYDEQYGIELCKKRFRKSPLRAETGLFLTKDMVSALIRNEIRYIEKNWNKFVPKSNVVNENNEVNADKLPFHKFRSRFNRNEKKQEVNEKAVEKEEKQEDFKAGDYVRIFTSEKEDSPVTIGLVKSVDENNVYCSWIVTYGNKNGVGFDSFKYSSNPKHMFANKSKVQLATRSELAGAIDYIKNRLF